MTLGEILVFEAYTYNFLTLACTEVFFLITSIGLLTGDKDRGGIPGEDIVVEEATTDNGGLEVTVVFSGTDDDILVSPAFW